MIAARGAQIGVGGGGIEDDGTVASGGGDDVHRAGVVADGVDRMARQLRDLCEAGLIAKIYWRKGQRTQRMMHNPRLDACQQIGLRSGSDQYRKVPFHNQFLCQLNIAFIRPALFGPVRGAAGDQQDKWMVG